jgi:hypothetical protein
VFITVGVILKRLVLELNWLDGVDGAHGLGKCLVDKISWLLFFEQSGFYWLLFFVKTYSLRFLTFVRGLNWIEQPLSSIKCLIHSFWSGRYNSDISIFLILHYSSL